MCKNTPEKDSDLAAGSNIWRIVEAEFEKSVVELKELPDDGLREIAFVGRSNAGKSSLLNAICERRALARVSKTPGRTQAINMFAIRLRCDSSSEVESNDAVLRFADLPGYGYAKVAAAMKEQWRVMLGEYLMYRTELSCIMVAHDSRRKISDEERWFFEQCPVPAILVATKIDKLKNSELSTLKKRYVSDLGIDTSRIVPVSLLKSNHPGLRRVMELIVDSTLDK